MCVKKEEEINAFYGNILFLCRRRTLKIIQHAAMTDEAK